MFFESVITIFEEDHIIFHPNTFVKKLGVLLGMIISKSFYAVIIVGLVYGLDHTKSDGFRCRKLQNGTDFLLTNDTKAADYLRMNLTQIYETRKKNAQGIPWRIDQLKGLLSEVTYQDFITKWSEEPEKQQFEPKFNNIADIIEAFNVYGFHDVCNAMTQSFVVDTWTEPPVGPLPPWFLTKNATGRFNLIEI